MNFLSYNKIIIILFYVLIILIYLLIILLCHREKVTIPIDKPYIYLEGADRKLTSIEWNDHADTADSVTFTSFSDNIVAKDITFKVLATT